METFIEIQSIILILIIAAVVISILSLFIYRSEKKAERRIRDAFGKAPSREKEDLELSFQREI